MGDIEALQPPDWTCRCGATNPPEFGTCWICGRFHPLDPDALVYDGRGASDA